MKNHKRTFAASTEEWLFPVRVSAHALRFPLSQSHTFQNFTCLTFDFLVKFIVTMSELEGSVPKHSIFCKKNKKTPKHDFCFGTSVGPRRTQDIVTVQLWWHSDHHASLLSLGNPSLPALGNKMTSRRMIGIRSRSSSIDGRESQQRKYTKLRSLVWSNLHHWWNSQLCW